MVLSAPDLNIMEDWVVICACAIGQGSGAVSASGDDPSFAALLGDVAMSGELSMCLQGRAWERKFVVLAENVLYFCKDAKANDAYMAIDMENVLVKEERTSGQFGLCFMQNVTFLFDCKSDQLRTAWLSKTICFSFPVVDFLLKASWIRPLISAAS
jgi:hypothetical protein